MHVFFDATANGNNDNANDIATGNDYHTSRRNEGVEIVRLLLEADADKNTLYVKDRYDSLCSLNTEFIHE